MSLESKILELQGNAAVEALFTLAGNRLDLTSPSEPEQKMREIMSAQEADRALRLAAELADSGRDVELFTQYVLLQAAELDSDREEVEQSVDAAGTRAFLEGGDVLNQLLIIGALYLANLRRIKVVRKTKQGKDGSTQESSIDIQIESRAKLKDFLQLFDAGPGADGE
jgi:hypothetical protein